MKLWRIFSDVFQCLPIAGLIDDKILCMHGGLSPELANMNQIRDIKRPTTVPDQGKAYFGLHIDRSNLRYVVVRSGRGRYQRLGRK